MFEIPSNFRHHSTWQSLINSFKLKTLNVRLWVFCYKPFLLLFRQIAIALWTTFFMILKSWWRLSKPKHLTWLSLKIIIIIMLRHLHGYPWPFSPSFSIFHCFRQLFRNTSRIGTEQLYVGSSWSCCLCSSMWRGPQEYITYEFVLTSPTVSRMSGSFNFDSFRDGWYAAVQLLLCGVLPPRVVQYCLQHSRVVAVKRFLHTFS